MLVNFLTLKLFSEYYPNPHTFNPERFNEEHGGIKSFRDRCVLLPFGEGPRICLGMKFGILLVKTIIVEALKNFEISIGDETSQDWKISVSEFLNIPEEKIQLKFEVR